MAAGPTEQSVEDTKRQIRSLVSEISEMSKGETSADEYYPAVLQRVVSALAAQGGAVWEIDGDNQVKLACQIQIDESLVDRDSESAQSHLRLLGHIAGRKESELVPPNSSFGDNGEIANPTPFLLVLSPLLSGAETAGVIEVFQRPDSPPDTQRGYLRFLEHMAKLIGEWLKGQSLQKVSDRQLLWQQSDQFARFVHDNLDLKDTAFTIANEGRRVIECDRVTVATMKGRNAKVVAISGQDSIENRSNIVTALNNLATKVVRSGEALWYDGDTTDLPPQLEVAVEDYVDLSHGRTVAVLPIHRPEDLIEGDVKAKDKNTTELNVRREIIGALIVEQIETQIPKATLEGKVDLVYEHSCRALANSMTYNHLFLMPVWRLLGRGMWLFRGSALPKTLGILALVAVALAAMFIVQIDFKLKGEGTLDPLYERNVFATTDGEVVKTFVEHGDLIRKGEPIIQLENKDLALQLENTRSELLTADENLRRVERLAQTVPSAEDRSRFNSEKAEYELQFVSLSKEFKLLQQKSEQLVRYAPIDGVVTTWEVKKSLEARPVSAGQSLLTIADTSSDWVLNVDMPEKRMGYLDSAFQTAMEDGQDHLPVEFILMTDPSKSFSGKLFKEGKHQRAEVKADEGTFVRLRIVPDDLSTNPFPGARVVARVKCGKRNAAFVWFHEVVEWVRAKLF